VPPLVAACKRGDFEAVKNLVQSGAKVDPSNPQAIYAVMEAAGFGRVQTVRCLLEQGIQVNTFIPGATETPLFYAIHERSFEIIKMLIRAGADVNLPNKFGTTPLMMASFDNDVELIQLLKANGANFNSPRRNLYSPPVMAMLQNFIKYLQP
jgi:hypothetical protein